MKKVLFISLILILLCFSLTSYAVVTNSSYYSNVKAYVFYSEENDEYNQEKQWLDDSNIRKEYINTNENEELYNKTKDAFNVKKDKLPLTIIGEEIYNGYSDKTKEDMQKTIDEYNNNEDKYVDIIEKIRNNEDVKDELKNGSSSNILIIFRNIVIAVLVIFILVFLFKKVNKNKKKNKNIRTKTSRH